MVIRRQRRARGMTLVEVMIALVVTTVASAPSSATVGATIRGTSFSRNASEASALAQSQLEAAVSLPTVSASSPVDGTRTVESQLDGAGLVNPTLGAYTRTTSWSTTADGLRRVVTVTVGWVDGLGGAHQVTAARQKDPQ
jgi:prepilin-type N-terminal cleavage/methylation domain-containing protein